MTALKLTFDELVVVALQSGAMLHIVGHFLSSTPTVG